MMQSAIAKRFGAPDVVPEMAIERKMLNVLMYHIACFIFIIIIENTVLYEKL